MPCSFNRRMGVRYVVIDASPHQEDRKMDTPAGHRAGYLIPSLAKGKRECPTRGVGMDDWQTRRMAMHASGIVAPHSSPSLSCDVQVRGEDGEDEGARYGPRLECDMTAMAWGLKLEINVSNEKCNNDRSCPGDSFEILYRMKCPKVLIEVSSEPRNPPQRRLSLSIH